MLAITKGDSVSKTAVISLLWLILGIFACISAYHSALVGNEWVETIKMGLLMLGGLGVIIAIIYQAESLVENSKQIAMKMDFDRVENAFELLKDWDNPSLLEARKYTREIKKNRDIISDQSLLNQIASTNDLEHSLVMTFNFWEQIYLSIENERVDESIVKQAFGQLYCDMYKRFEVWINQSSSSDTKTSLKALNDKWKS